MSSESDAVKRRRAMLEQHWRDQRDAYEEDEDHPLSVKEWSAWLSIRFSAEYDGPVIRPRPTDIPPTERTRDDDESSEISAKAAVLIMRAERHEDLWHPGDAKFGENGKLHSPGRDTGRTFRAGGGFALEGVA